MHLSTSRFLLCLLLLAGLALPSTRAEAKRSAPEVTCSACLVVDDTGRELFARAASRTLPNASTTKMTTALVVVAEASPDETVMVSAEAAATGGGGLDLHTGEIWDVRALLYALLLDSSNDAAVALAEHVAGTEADFVDEMNRTARAIGATGTHFVTAHGLDMVGHGSTARDLAATAAELLKDPLLAAIVATPRARIEGPAGIVTIENRNLLLESYSGAIGVKTGFTAGAGNVLVAAAERNGRRLIAVAMHSVDATVDAAALLDFGWARLAQTVVLRAGTPVAALVFDRGSTPVVTSTPVRDLARHNDVTFEFRPWSVEAPLAAGDVVGRVVVRSPDGTIETVDAVATGAVVPDETSWAVDVFTGLLRGVGELVGEPE